MKPGDIILTPLPQADGRIKVRPALLLQVWQPFGDFLVCGISSRLHRIAAELDEIISPSDSDFSTSGLREVSLVRLGYLGTVAATDVAGVLGRISRERLKRLQQRLGRFLSSELPSPRRILGIIPARFASTRFPGKPLTLIRGKPLVQHVVERCQRARSLAEVIVATDDPHIREVAQTFCRVELTASEHASGSDRVAEVAERCSCDAVVNIQGDEPLIDPAVIDAVANALQHDEMSTAATRLHDLRELDNPNVVKVVVNSAGHALYFSRRTIPFVRDAASRSREEQLAAFPFLKHLGIYGYRRETLLRLVRYPLSALEKAERLEQLRALENGLQIAVAQVEYDSVGVDVPEDVARVERLMQSQQRT